MRIVKLGLEAFGPFTDLVLEFDDSGLHVIHGSNEAGKSSALRGLTALLYGVPERTTDNFLHSNDKLRIKGELCAENGQRLAFVRRKGRKNTLVDSQGSVLGEQVLSPFLTGVSQDVFRTLFGIDHRALVEGGREILAQKGEVGQVLFSAALGGYSLHAVLNGLEEEANQLFRPRGSVQQINKAIREYQGLQKEMRQQSLSASTWADRHRSLDRTVQELREVESSLRTSRTELNRLERIRRVLPKFARRRESLQSLEALGEVVLLSEDFRERRLKIEEELNRAQAVLKQETARLTDYKSRRDGLSIRQELLAQAIGIDDLKERRGSEIKALRDRIKLETELEGRQSERDGLLKDVQPDSEIQDLEQLKLVLQRQHRLNELGNRKAVLQADMRRIEDDQQETKRCLDTVRQALASLPEARSTMVMRKAIQAARKEGDLDAEIRNAMHAYSMLSGQCDAERARLGLADRAVEGLAVPGRETIVVFEQDFSQSDQNTARLEEQRDALARDLSKTQSELEAIHGAGTVPTEDDLRAVRKERDQFWRQLRLRWVDAKAGPEPIACDSSDESLAAEFENRQERADNLSDRLYREAERVHKQAGIQAECRNLSRQLEDAEDRITAYAEKRKDLESAWREIWDSCGIKPRSPREMRDWLDDFERLREKSEELNTRRTGRNGLEARRKQHLGRLDGSAAVIGEAASGSIELESALLRYESLADGMDASRRDRESLEKTHQEKNSDRRSLDETADRALRTFGDWETEWADNMQRIGLEGDATPGEVAGMCEKIRQLFALEKEIGQLQHRIKKIDRDSGEFAKQVAAICEQVAPELCAEPACEAVQHLSALLEASRTKQIQYQETSEQIERSRQVIRQSEDTVHAQNLDLEALCREAGRARPSELPDAESRSEQYQKIQQAVFSTEQEILDAGEGAVLGALEAESQGEASDALPGKIQELRTTIEEELEPRRTGLAEKHGREKKELELMDGSDEAAACAARARDRIARIRSCSERYVQVKLASKILKDHIEWYRSRHQGPMVERASKFFSTLTDGSFAKLETGFDKHDQPVLFGVRTNGKNVPVAGMSSGARDQLYLALRLASLEQYMDRSESMPFIIDDVLIEFDDQRTRFALDTFFELGKRTQVIIFTHHNHVVKQARSVGRPVQVLCL